MGRRDFVQIEEEEVGNKSQYNLLVPIEHLRELELLMFGKHMKLLRLLKMERMSLRLNVNTVVRFILPNQLRVPAMDIDQTLVCVNIGENMNPDILRGLKGKGGHGYRLNFYYEW